MFAKFLLTVAVIALIWFGFKYMQRMGEMRARREAQPPQAQPRPKFEPDPDGESVQDLVKCPKCSTYRSSKLGSCGRSDCPY